MFLDRFRYEIQLLGKRVILTPMLIMVGFACLAFLLHNLHTNPARTLSASLEIILPLAAGLVVATITSQDPAIELQLSMPRSYDRTALDRLTIIAGWTIVIALLSSITIFALKLAFVPQPSQSWPAPLQFLTGSLPGWHPCSGWSPLGFALRCCFAVVRPAGLCWAASGLPRSSSKTISLLPIGSIRYFSSQRRSCHSLGLYPQISSICGYPIASS